MGYSVARINLSFRNPDSSRDSSMLLLHLDTFCIISGIRPSTLQKKKRMRMILFQPVCTIIVQGGTAGCYKSGVVLFDGGY